MTYPPQGPGPGNSGPYGQVPPNHGGQPRQQFPPQSPPPQGFSPQGQGGPQQWQGQPGPGGQPQQPHGQQWAPPQQQQPQWGQQPPPNPQGTPGGKPPVVLIGVAAVAVLAILIGVIVVVAGGDDDSDTTAAKPTTTAAPAATTESSKTTTTGKSTTTTSTKAAAAVPAEVQPILDAMPAALRSAVAPNFNRTTKPGYTDDDAFDTGADFNIGQKDALIAGLTDGASKDRAVLAHISTDPSKLPALWRKQFPDRLTEQGGKLIRFNDKSVSGTMEYFNPSTNLYIAVTGFKDKAAVMTFIERAGL
ncbi:hypothetical protein ABZ319_21125 [Nocardia sp. NPDC005978]|uniref:hypothetical protein n=1 Tax=Nocardia sp. NPDC005978 TaxID=3156725 RepID=UPI00339ED38B